MINLSPPSGLPRDLNLLLHFSQSPSPKLLGDREEEEEEVEEDEAL